MNPCIRRKFGENSYTPCLKKNVHAMNDHSLSIALVKTVSWVLSKALLRRKELFMCEIGQCTRPEHRNAFWSFV